MTHPPEHDPLLEALTKLPRQQTSASFTEDVLAAVDQRIENPSTHTHRLVWATALTLIVGALLTVGIGYQRQRVREQAYRLQVEELRSRYQELLSEVATVRNEVESPDARVYLGGDETVDLVLDLRQSPTFQQGTRDHQDVRPANWEQ